MGPHGRIKTSSGLESQKSCATRLSDRMLATHFNFPSSERRKKGRPLPKRSPNCVESWPGKQPISMNEPGTPFKYRGIRLEAFLDNKPFKSDRTPSLSSWEGFENQKQSAKLLFALLSQVFLPCHLAQDTGSRDQHGQSEDNQEVHKGFVLHRHAHTKRHMALEVSDEPSTSASRRAAAGAADRKIPTLCLRPRTCLR